MSKKSSDPIVRLLSILCPMIYFASYLTRKNYGIVMEAVISAEGVTNAQAGLVETLALIPSLTLLGLLTIIVGIDAYIRPNLKRTMRCIIAVVFSLVIQNFLEYRVIVG